MGDQTEDEYAAARLTVLPIDIPNFLVDRFLVSMERALDDMQTTASQEWRREKHEAILAALTDLRSKYKERMRLKAPKFAAFMKEQFMIPPHVLLPEDSIQAQQYSADEYDDLERRCRDATKEIEEMRKEEEALVAAEKRLDDMIAAEKEVLLDITRLETRLKSLSSTDAERLLSRMDNLTQLIQRAQEELCPVIATVPVANGRLCRAASPVASGCQVIDRSLIGAASPLSSNPPRERLLETVASD